uniref:HR-like lesion-inducer n=1 Tax=Salix viminalis TaxID=40686 RepID=A0A6N2LY28_SALVM
MVLDNFVGCSAVCYLFHNCSLLPNAFLLTAKLPVDHRESIFIVHDCRFNEFGSDGGPAANLLAPKFLSFSKHVSSHTGFQVPHFEMKYAIAAAISVKAAGSLLFIFGSSIGAYLLLLHQLIVTPIVYDFYNYDADTKEFNLHFAKFAQNLALFGALLFFIGMKNSIPRRQLKKRSPKSKTL